MTKKYIYFFTKNKAEGGINLKQILGGKGANLAEMAKIGIPVPPGFTISAEVCQKYIKDKRFSRKLKPEIEKNLNHLEKEMGKKFGDPNNPLLVSVRSGAAISMPGMMDTILNLGLNSKSVLGLAKQTNDLRFARDTYRRLIQMFSNVVIGIDLTKFEKELEKIKAKRKVTNDIDLSAEDLEFLIQKYKQIFKQETGKNFPESPKQQLFMAIDAVFNSWNNPRAIKYRKINKINNLLGTAVNIQAMVFGNLGSNSATGVAFTRNPASGENKFYGEYLPQAQGEDVVAGIRTPRQLTKYLSRQWAKSKGISESQRKAFYPSLQESMPKIFNQLNQIRNKLERHYRDLQDLEFTIQQGKLYILQTRTGKRTGRAAVKIAVDMVKEKLIDKSTAILRVSPEKINELLHQRIDPQAKLKILGTGLPASPGAAVGEIIFDSNQVETEVRKNKKVILVRHETSPEDVGGMSLAEGILTAVGGMTSHAAIVARGLGKCCLVGCGELSIDYQKRTCTIGSQKLKQGDLITLDGTKGRIIKGAVNLVRPKLTGDLAKLISWANQIKKLGVRANAETPKDVRKAKQFGAEGIGLSRTEHMFFKADRITAIRRMIFAETESERKKALDSILPLQKNDFKKIFKIMDGLPVTIRLLDPPLHEFLPKTKPEIKALAKTLNLSVQQVNQKIENLSEINPMLGYRGCRLGISYPEITRMQTRAIIEAAIELQAKNVKVKPEIMIPLISLTNEFKNQEKIIKDEIKKIFKEKKQKIKYQIGTMIETPRACLIADQLAESAQFFSFGTNDLTQMVFGFSRDDIGEFLPLYIDQGIIDRDPFMTIDQSGVGKLIKIAVNQGRNSKPNLKIGICGEQGGEPDSVEFCHQAGLDYISCSPFRVPIAKLAAAQVAIRNQ